MRYGILGPLELRDGSDVVTLPRGHVPLLLAVLLLHPNEVLSRERLVDALWADEPPATATRSLHNLVSTLRKALGDGELVTRGHGYALTVGEGELDALAFDRLGARGRSALDDGAPELAASILREALALWRGPALADLVYEPALQGAAERLEDQRLTVLEDRVDADLALGRHTALVGELDPLVAAHPLRERLRGQQMLALYRCGRQADALHAYQDARRRLRDELGLAPGLALQRLERAMLEQEPALGVPDVIPLGPGEQDEPTRPPPMGSPGRRWVALAAAALVAAGLAGFWRAHGAAPPPAPAAAPNSLAALDPATGRIVASLPVGATPIAAAVGAGAAWTVNADGQTISRVDLRRLTVRTFGTGAIPMDIAAGAGGVWVVGATRNPGTAYSTPPSTLTRVDTNAGASVPLLPSGGPALRGPPALVAVDGSMAWAMGRTGRLQRFDVRSGRVVDTPRLQVYDIAAGEGQVWAVIVTKPGSTRPNLVQLDPVTGEVRARVYVPWASLGGLAVGAGAVWLTDPYAGVVWRVSPGPKPVLRTVEVDVGVDSVAAARGAVWAASSVAGTVSRLDLDRNRVGLRVALGQTPRAVAIGGGRVWVAVAPGPGRPAATLAPDLRGCEPVLTARGATPDLLLTSDLPFQGSFGPTTRPMTAAVAFILRAHHFRAGRFRIGLQSCDDSTALTGEPDGAKCAANAKAYAANPRVVGVVGPMHSSCAASMLPVLNRAPGGPVALVSPSNGWVNLVRQAPDAPAGELRSFYPTGQRGYARVVPSDDYVMAGAALEAQRLGATKVYYLVGDSNANSPWHTFFATAARRLGLRLVGMSVWDPERSSFDALARRARRSGADAIVVDGATFNRVGDMLRAVRKENGDTPIIGTPSMIPLPQVFAQAGSAMRGVHIVTGGLPIARLDAAGRRFVHAFAATQPGGDAFSAFTVYAAAATEVLLDAIARSDGTRESVARALAATRLRESALGPLSLDAHGELTAPPVTVVRAEHAGGRELVDSVDGAVVEAVLVPPQRLVSAANDG